MFMYHVWHMLVFVLLSAHIAGRFCGLPLHTHVTVNALLIAALVGGEC